MATEDDNFDIDIYGDGGGYNGNEQGDYKEENTDLILDGPESGQNGSTQEGAAPDALQGNGDSTAGATQDAAPRTNSVSQDARATQTPTPQQGVKRKELDNRPSDPDATTALLVGELHWWTTDDEIRGWVNEANCEDELKDVTFSEHKVNGKSKGQAYIELTSQQAASAVKHKIESFSAGGQGRKYMVHYTSPFSNPFRTLPKDNPMRKDGQTRAGSGGFHTPGAQNMNFGMNNMGGGTGGGFRGGGRGGYNRGGGMTPNMGGYGGGNRNNFGGNMAGGGGGFQGSPMVGGGFQGGGPMGGMQNYGGFNNRGNMMGGGGMRGGPGGMRGRGGGGMAGPNMMGMPAMGPMGVMGMNPMAGAMNPMMGGMGANMGMQGFQGPNAAFSQGFFPQNQGAGDGSWNPHGAKRSRQE